MSARLLVSRLPLVANNGVTITRYRARRFFKMIVE